RYGPHLRHGTPSSRAWRSRSCSATPRPASSIWSSLSSLLTALFRCSAPPAPLARARAGGVRSSRSEHEHESARYAPLGYPGRAFRREAAVEIAPDSVVTRWNRRDPEPPVDPEPHPLGLAEHVAAAAADVPGEPGVAPDALGLRIEDPDAKGELDERD